MFDFRDEICVIVCYIFVSFLTVHDCIIVLSPKKLFSGGY